MGLEFRVQDLGFRVFRFPCIEGFGLYSSLCCTLGMGIILRNPR